MKMTLPKWTGTAAGAVLGAAALPFAWPVAVVILGAGAASDVWRHKHGHALAITAGPGAGTTAAAPPHAQVMKIIIAASPKAAAAPAAATAASLKAAAAPPVAATDLHNYLVKYPGDRMVEGATFFTIAPVPQLVTDFQNAFNADATAVAALGKLTAHGRYDGQTSAALAFYTHDPIPAP